VLKSLNVKGCFTPHPKCMNDAISVLIALCVECNNFVVACLLYCSQ